MSTTITVLMTDLVESTSLLDHGDEAYDGARRTHFAVVRHQLDEHGGVEVKSTGDGMMATFSSASGAVEAAIAIQQGADRLQRRDQRSPGVRVALAAGEATSEEGDWYGRPVVEAARICDLAEGGQVLATGTVPLLVGGRRDTFRPLGDRRLKGLDDPVQLVEVRWEPTRSDAGDELVGRAEEIAEIDDALRAVAAGDSRVIVVEGEPGIGKTRLMAAVAELSERYGLVVLRGSGDELERDRPFRAFADVLDLSDGSAAMTGAHPADESPDPAFVVVDRILDELEVRSRRAPVALLLDDIQWADPDTLRAVRSVIRHLPHVRLLLVVSMRPMPRSTDHDGLIVDALAAGCRHLSLESLGQEPLALLAQQVLGARPAPSLVDHLDRTGGNPLYAIELMKALREERAIDVAGGEASIRDEVVPPGLRLTILRRLGALTPRTLDVLRTASVLGTRFSASTLSSVLDRPAGDLIPALDEAIRGGFLRQGSDGELCFSHDLVREVLYEELPLDLRRVLHRQAADALTAAERPVEEVGQHATLAGARGDPAVVRWLLDAGEQATRTSVRAAVNLFEQARAQAAHGSIERGHACVALASGLTRLGRPADAEPVAREGLEILDDVRAHYMLLVVHSHLGRADELPAEGAAIVGRSEITRADRAACRAMVASQLLMAGQADEARPWLAGAVEDADASGDHYAVALSSMAAALLGHVDGAVDRALERSARAVDAADGADAARTGPVVSDFVRALVLLDTDRLDEARTVARRGHRRCESAGFVPWLAACLWLLGLVDLIAGEYDDAIASFETSIAVGKENDSRLTLQAVPYALLGYVALARGNLPAAEDALAHGHELVAEIGPGLGADLLLWLEALVAEARGDDAAATRHVTDAWLLTESLPHLLTRRLVAPDAVRLLRTVDPEAADSVVRSVDDLSSRAGGHLPVIALAERCRGLRDDDADLLRSAADAYRGAGRVVDAAACTEEAARALVRAGRSGEAVDLLEEAVEVYEEVGTTRYTQRAQAALRELGVHRRRRTTPRRDRVGWESLTPSETDVVRLVAEGLTNREIGEQLYISRRTVETHLSHVFAKLGLSNRSQVAAEAVRSLGR